jgi:hypothetical protein
MGFLEVKSPSRARRKIQFFREGGGQGKKEKGVDPKNDPPLPCNPPRSDLKNGR